MVCFVYQILWKTFKLYQAGMVFVILIYISVPNSNQCPSILPVVWFRAFAAELDHMKVPIIWMNGPLHGLVNP